MALERLNIDIGSLHRTINTSTKKNVELDNQLTKYVQRKNDLLSIQLVVSFFIDKTLEYQAMIFSTINRTQKRVSDSLVSSLFGLTTKDSPQKTALQVVLVLNGHKHSPFFNRVNLYGQDYSRHQSPPLSQATMVRSIVGLICENLREAERDRFRNRKALRERSPGSAKLLPFRKYYANDQDAKISDIFFYFFSAVRASFKDSDGVPYWDFNPETMKPSNILQTTVGYIALLNLLVDILEQLKEDQRFKVKSYESYLAKATDLNFKDVKRYPFTSRSQTVLYLDLNLSIWPAESGSDKRILKLEEILNKE